jgi:hypothetical protein
MTKNESTSKRVDVPSSSPRTIAASFPHVEKDAVAVYEIHGISPVHGIRKSEALNRSFSGGAEEHPVAQPSRDLLEAETEVYFRSSLSATLAGAPFSLNVPVTLRVEWRFPAEGEPTVRVAIGSTSEPSWAHVRDLVPTRRLTMLRMLAAANAEG